MTWAMILIIMEMLCPSYTPPVLAKRAVGQSVMRIIPLTNPQESCRTVGIDDGSPRLTSPQKGCKMIGVEDGPPRLMHPKEG